MQYYADLSYSSQNGHCPYCGRWRLTYFLPDLCGLFRETSRVEVSVLGRESMSHALTYSRNTPIWGLHRVIWLHIPHGMRVIDRRLTNGRLSTSIFRTAHTLWNDRHPTIMVRKYASF
jgi:hypothetical protein